MATLLNRLSQVDQALFILRWLLVGCVVGLAFAMPLLDPPGADVLRQRLIFAALLGAGFTLLGMILHWRRPASPRPGAISVALDTLFTLVLFWASGGMTVVLLGAGMIPIVVGALRAGSLPGAAAALALALAAPFVYRLATLPPGTAVRDLVSLPLPSIVLLTSAVLLLMGIIVGLPVMLASLAWTERQAILKAHETESTQLRITRRHTHAIYEMSAALNANLNVADVLEAALDVGLLGLRELDPNARPVSAVLLRDDRSGLLRVANARRLPPADLAHQTPGQAGVLAEASARCTPIFASEAQQDPELRAFQGFTAARSLLCVPLCRQQENFGLLVFGSSVPDAFSEEHVELLRAVANQATVALQNARLYQDLVEEKERLLEVEEDARKQLSRELHDGPTQSVAAIAMRVNYIRRLLERQPDQVPPELHKVEE
ncbi:MAG: GAF domain-containing protein, partial [Anaerolineae bacterium]|nr:GAF domain-containing protein [Anaerolineae bacterium]